MKSRAPRLAFAICLALAPRAWAASTFEAVLIGTNEVPGPGISEGSFDAVVVVDGAKVTLTLTPKGIKGWMAAHIHMGAAGVDGKLVAEFPWESGDSSPRTYVGSVSEEVAADMVANPQDFYVHVHLPDFPAGGARGQLATAAGYDPKVAQETGVPRLAPPDTPETSLPSSRRAQSIKFLPARSRVFRDGDFRLEASASSGLHVSFTGSGDCTVNGPTVHILSAGKCWVTAHQPGDARFEAAPDVEQLIPVAKAGQRIAGAAPEFKTYLDPDFPLDMSATSGLTVVFFASGDCTVDGSYVHITGAGSCSLTAHQPGDSNYLAARIVDQRFPIARADQTIAFAEFSTSYYGPFDLSLNASASSDLPVAYSAWGACAMVGSSTLRMLDSGECSVTADQPGDRNFNAAPSVKRTFQIVVPSPPPERSHPVSGSPGR